MELLAGYASSSSTSSIDSLLRNDQRQTSCTLTCKGANKRGGESTAHGEGKNSACPIEKRRKLCTNRNNGCMPQFERNHPHWEGRWVGHLHLPFPPLEQLDSSSLERWCDDEVSSYVGSKNKVLTHEHRAEYAIVLQNSKDASCNDDSSSCEEIDDITLQSRMFLPAARILIYHWEVLLKESGSGCYDERNNSTSDGDLVVGSRLLAFAVVPHIPMQPFGYTTITTTLHISLARPIHLPSASVDSFMTCIEKSIQAVIGITCGGVNHANQRQQGRILHVQPRNATIFTNDQQNRSFLSIPISKESSRWVKRSLLPPIDAAMVRFGLETYYHSLGGGEGCILHVSVASVKGNVIPQMLQHRSKKNDSLCGMHSDAKRSIRSLSLFVTEGEQVHAAGCLKPIPSSIPILFDRIQCTFGKDKQLTIPI